MATGHPIESAQLLRHLGMPFAGVVEMPSELRPRVLLIDATSCDRRERCEHRERCVDFLLGADTTDASGPLDVEHLSFDPADDGAGVRACQDAITSGDFHAVVLGKIILSDSLNEKLVERLLSTQLQAFARAGGRVAFLAGDGLVLARNGLVDRIFGSASQPCNQGEESSRLSPHVYGDGLVACFGDTSSSALNLAAFCHSGVAAALRQHRQRRARAIMLARKLQAEQQCSLQPATIPSSEHFRAKLAQIKLGMANPYFVFNPIS